MTDEYIRKQDALDAFGLSEKTRKYGGDHSGYDTRMLYEIQDTIESIEPADVAPVVHSQWIKTADGAECEKCGREAVYQIVDDHWEYEPWCPHCGAKMDEGE